MKYYYSTLIAVFVILAYFIITDPNAAPFFWLQSKILSVELRKKWLIIKMWPMVKYQSWKMKREMKRIRRDYGLPDDKD